MKGSLKLRVDDLDCDDADDCDDDQELGSGNSIGSFQPEKRPR